MRKGDMCSVRQVPSTSLRPYSTKLSSPALYTMHTCGLSKKKRSLPDPAHGTSDSLQLSRS